MPIQKGPILAIERQVCIVHTNFLILRQGMSYQVLAMTFDLMGARSILFIGEINGLNLQRSKVKRIGPGMNCVPHNVIGLFLL